MTEIELHVIHPIEAVEEAYGVPTAGSTIFRGIAITKGLTMNGRYFDVPILETIAKQLKGMPVMYGDKFEVDGVYHRKANQYAVGTILDSWLDRSKTKVWYDAKVKNTNRFPDIQDKVREGMIRFGSIGGKGEIEESRGMRNVKTMFVTHFSLVAIPGDPNAKITEIIQESFGNCTDGVCIPILGCTRVERNLNKLEDELRQLMRKSF
jgi:hypothetical protein